MGRLVRVGGWLCSLLLVVPMLGAAVPGAASAAPAPAKQCAVSSGRTPESAMPAEVGLDARVLADAVAFAASRNRLNVQIFRHNCLVGVGPRNAETGNIAWNMWSVTKSVVSMATGIAWDEGRIRLDDPVGKYLPPGLGDAAHRAIRVRHLLTETSGLQSAVVSEGTTGVIPLDPNIPVQALGLPLEHEPGTYYEYNQRAVDLLVHIVELAVGEDFQSFVQRKLFDPLGIARSDYHWARDRTGHSYGYSYLMLPPNDLAKLGLLMLNDGSWNGTSVLSADWVRLVRTPSPRNSCYGFLFWLGGPGCDATMGGAPADAYAMSGAGLQNAMIVPSLDLMVSWTGVGGNVSMYGIGGTLQNSGELIHNFFRTLGPAFTDVVVPDPGPYIEPPVNFDPKIYTNPETSLAPLGIGPSAYPGCSIFRCLGETLAPPFADWPPGCALFVCLGNDPATPGIR